MTSTTTELIGSFRTVVRPDDPLVRDHRLNGVPALSGLAYLDAICRAAQAGGHLVDHWELHDIRFSAPLELAENTDQQLLFRSAPHLGGVRVRVSSRPAGADDEEQPRLECFVSGPGAAGPAPSVDVDDLRRVLAAGDGSTLDPVYRRLEELGVDHLGFTRARGSVTTDGDDLIAELVLGTEASARQDGFLLHPVLLDAAVAVLLYARDDGALARGIDRFRLWSHPGEAASGPLYARARPAATAGPDGTPMADLTLHDALGRTVAELYGLVPAPVTGPEAAPRTQNGTRPVAGPARESGTVHRSGVRPRSGGLDIAVVGMSGRYPGAEDLAQFWQNLRTGQDAITEIPAERWRHGEYPTAGTHPSTFGGFLDSVDVFDPLFFRIPPSNAVLMDPQERLFLQTAYGAVENAGYRPEDFTEPRDRIGVFVGATWTDYRLFGVESTRAGHPQAVTSGLSSIANRTSYFFGFTGPSMAVDTACSSSLTALHLACRSIALGECEGAVVGGVNLLLHPDRYLLLTSLNMTSSDGRCRSFGAGGDGYVPGEGVGAIFLKPLARALADRDTVHGVVRGTGVNHGGTAAGYTVPQPAAQAAAVRRALSDADTDPDTIGYIEAHGTGTSLGDPVEVVGLQQAFRGRTRPGFLGSVKSNIGHLEAAAGIAALTKTLLQMRHGQIVPSLHSTVLNPEIDFSDVPFQVPQHLTPWPRERDQSGDLPLRAGVSSFGAGGSNAHAVLEEYPQEAVPPADGRPEILVLSARTPERLSAYAQRIARYLRDTGEPFRDIARTLQIGRPELPVRLALVASDAPEAAAGLERFGLAAEGEPVPEILVGTAHASTPTPPGETTDAVAVAQLWVDGAKVDWAVLNDGPSRRLPVPGYPFERRKLWIEGPTTSVEAAPIPEPAPVAADLDRSDASADSVPTAAERPTMIPLGATPNALSDEFLAQVAHDFESGLAAIGEELEGCYPLLGRYGAIAVHRRLREMGLPDEALTTEELRRRLDVSPAFSRFFDACLHVMERHGLMRYDGALVRGTGRSEDPDRLRTRLLAEYPESAPFIRLLDVCLESYPDTLRGRRPAIEVLFPGSNMDLLAGIYRGNRVYDFYSALAARFVSTAAVACAGTGSRPVRVLEIGAGTGGTSHAALAELANSGVEVEYWYTDIGGSFVAHGRKTFGPKYPFARFQLLDIEKDPEAQGFANGDFDVVFAVGALHAVSDIDEAMRRVRLLLKPSGLLVLGEAVENHDVMAVTIGLLDGWHLYRDPERRVADAPLLSVEGWQASARRTGFGAFTAYGPGLTADRHPSHRVIVMAATPTPTAVSPARPTATEPDAGASAAVEDAIRKIVSEELGVLPDEVQVEASFAEYGVDSIMALKLVEQVNTRFGIDIKATTIFDYPSVHALAEFAFAEGARSYVPQPTPVGEASPRVIEERAHPGPDRAIGGTGPALDIAVIGMSGRYPGAANHRELWRNVAAGKDSVTEIPPERWNLAEYYQPWPPAPGRTYSRWGGYLTDVDRFDPLFFGIVPAEADFIDPQQRIFLEESWKAIEDAGLNPQQLSRSRCGVFAGAPPSDYTNLIRERGHFGSPHVFTGNSPAILPARVAYHLDLVGPTFGVDTACSSSLVALHQACQSLRAGECDLALAGGVAVFATMEHHLLTASVGMLSPTGRCRAFDQSGDGIAMSEGAGVVVLKPLAQALADGDPIYGVIKGSGVNQDGRTNGITAPSSRSQTELELDVYRRHGIDPSTIGYVEAHGTGTKLGDPIEIQALTDAFRHYTDRRGDVPIGSIKSNIGHASHAAGVAGLIKVLMAMREQVIPPSLHFEHPNELIDFPSTPFQVNTEARHWYSEGPRRAAVSSFGFSGTNAHLVVEEYPDTRPQSSPRRRQALITLSARTAESLRRGAAALRGYLDDQSAVALHDVAATTQTGRAVFGHRLAILAESVAQLREQLGRAAEGQLAAGVHRGRVDRDGQPAVRTRLDPGADLERVAADWVTGASYDFAGLYDGGSLRRVHLSGYAFEPESYWVPQPVSANGVGAAAGPHEGAEALSEPEVSSAGESFDQQVLAAVLAAATDELGVAPNDIDLEMSSQELGFDATGRVRVTARIARAMGIDLPPSALTVRTTLGELARRVAAEEWGRADPSAGLLPEPVAVPVGEPSGGVDQGGASGTDDLVEDFERYLARLLAAEVRLPLERIEGRVPLQDYGIESVLIVQLTHRLEQDFGPLPSTLFFEYQTLRELAGYFAAEHADRAAVVRTRPQSTVEARADRAPAATASLQVTDRVTGSAGPAGSVRDIAVVGMSGRYPMARNNDEFWANLLAGRDCITEVPADRWDHRAYLSDDREETGTTYARWGGFLEDVDTFDARFFNITPKDAELMDPQQRLFLESSWAALEDAGYTPARIRESARSRGRKDAGVFAGVTYGEYQAFVGVPIAGYWAVANRVSYHLGFNGPSMAVDTACSSSLTALHLACESLRRGECAYAVAGGVNVTIHPGKYLLLGSGQWASTDGRCRTFGAGGDGYVPSEGVATLLLKPLEDARQDDDRIYGVIRASAVNQDGRTNGFTVPNPNAQAALIHEALTEAGVDARAVGYVEAHGTGTSLGDPIEIAGLTKAYRRFTGDRGYCVIGSAKSGIGHLEAAAGVAGVVKTLLQMQHDTIAPSLHADPPNPGIDFANSPFEVAGQARPWPAGTDENPRLAAVSSFGAGGSNAHLIIEEYRPAPNPPAPVTGPALILLSARNADRLVAQAENLAGFLRSERGAGTSLTDVAWTLMVGREALEHRLVLVANSHQEAVRKLELFRDGTRSGEVQTGVVAGYQVSGGESEPDRAYLRALWEHGTIARLGELWTQGWVVDWTTLFASRRGRRVGLPTYPFARDRHWIDPAEFRRGDVDRPVPMPSFSGPEARAASEPSMTAPPSATSLDRDAPDLRVELDERIKLIFSDLTKQPVAELDSRANFIDFGFDSVMLVRMLNRLMKSYDARIPAAAIEECETIDALVDFVLDGGYVSDPEAGRSGDRDEVSQILRAPAVTPEKVSRAEPFAVDSIFVTGITGVLGGKLLHDLLSGTSTRITCLVRGDDAGKAKMRVRHFLDVYDEEGRLADEFERRVDVVLGDVAQDRLGLDAATYDRLTQDVDISIHAAARTTLVTFYDALAPTNVQGTRRMIDFALATKHKYLVYVSSFSALGDWQLLPNRPFTEADLELGQEYDHLPYQETKYHSEKLIRAASERGLMWNIFRPGNIMGTSDTGRYPFSEVTVKGVYYDLLKTAVDTGFWMEAPVHWDISPVDYVSAGIVHLALRRPHYRETYHLTNPDIRDLTDVYRMVEEYGYSIEPLSVKEYHRRGSEDLFRSGRSDDVYQSQMIEMVKYGVEIWGPGHYDRGTYADATYTRAILHAAGIDCPPIGELVPRYLQTCIANGYLPAPGDVAEKSDAAEKGDAR